MVKYLGAFLLVLLYLSCNSSNTNQDKPEPKIVDGASKYDVYTSSEMASLMKGMYAYNEQLKQEVVEGEVTLEFPESFLSIHKAKMTKDKGRSATFDHYSGKFIEAQQAIYDTENAEALEVRYNNAINMCLSCHKTECTGPIPKIKKLLIQ